MKLFKIGAYKISDKDDLRLALWIYVSSGGHFSDIQMHKN